jgi:predicted O-methyltransferase YrrM
MRVGVKKTILSIYDAITVLFTLLYMPIVKVIKKYGVHFFPLNRAVFLKSGIYPIQDHYYEPQFVFSETFDAAKIRKLNIDLHESEQLEALKDLAYTQELEQIPWKKQSGNVPSYYYENRSFEEGDADLYYLMIRNKKPKKIIEIGSGFSTLIALKAIAANKAEGFITELTCIEPYEFSWLEELENVKVVRKKVEEIEAAFFSALEPGDFLFVDSSHIIRPENDVLHEYFEIIPALKKGVIIHIHDIFTPRHYTQSWLTEELRLWNEQYLLEAFLSYNNSFRIIFSLNHLKNSYFDVTSSVLKAINMRSQPASFWIEKVN